VNQSFKHFFAKLVDIIQN